eukprot:CAMPEP_0206235690 /NCGR_PEP_ID=MMETSP0047_2-20121206/13292_1 /ASSEMBLY_ACC=CAM_ASM_000192 /TAXON_ID=195065 /ORGANISM="Chroomonas mesostigmatica_cf, Strain CCMP1168" /LENGTH=410 /DNA_ID=CAMNT_0053659927 /DNA_START=64 /DNA_END=1296 /DNA_ORIENTATION=-
MEQLFEGSDLLAKDGSAVKASALSADVVGIYFSAHWCPPCRGFTPVLAKTYEQARVDGKSFEIVFVSSDKDEGSFDEYRGTMPWLSLPFAQRELKGRLSKKFRVAGIPMLLLIDGTTGKVISKDGRAAISKDPMAAKFPWTPPTIQSAMGPTFVKSDGSEVDAKAALSGKHTAIYFSASWCSPCKQFTPKLIEAYQKLKDEGKDFEVVFVSADRDQKAFDGYFGKMPWLALPYSERDRESDLNELFSVEGIPHLVMVDPNGKVINKDMVGDVACDAAVANFPWKPKAVRDIDEAGGSLNEVPSVIVFGDAKGALEAPAKEAQERAEASGEEDEEMVFCTAAECGQGTIGGQVRKLCALGDLGDKAEMILLDIPDEGAYYTYEGEVTEEGVRKFLDGYKAKTLARKQLSRG